MVALVAFAPRLERYVSTRHLHRITFADGSTLELVHLGPDTRLDRLLADLIPPLRRLGGGQD
jgi:hypothetical protein